MNLEPLPGYALIKLNNEYQSGLTVEKDTFARRTQGRLIAKNETGVPVWNEENTIVYFAPYEDGDPIKYLDNEYVFVKLTELRGIQRA
jgi:hypothetical protein|nr:MAG TPA: 10 kDa chaperonin [Caudoviricetes sp.]